ncbi:hypothetical protein QO034_23035 [Sedimentitalea sp. JM2-8]|uniref:Uncharacterized protein n=1 Tax=Sedimentitalea xiamensis TaxID=3050037 RepID=A0ABT7FMH0_9RHOB|nr:hypothetical protein [Sedimentitalea xiamensis]MDK3075929.1 hypothetical protein [Sedimentitalea xiamensis]
MTIARRLRAASNAALPVFLDRFQGAAPARAGSTRAGAQLC